MGNATSKPAVRIISRAEEASRARSTAEFCSKLEGALQEADETQLWLELLRDDCGTETQDLQVLLQETDELMAMFVTIVERARRRRN
jgi:four helix bundle protein